MIRRQSLCVIDLDVSLSIAYRPRYVFAPKPKTGKASERRNFISAVSGLRFAVHCAACSGDLRAQATYRGRLGFLQIGSDEAQVSSVIRTAGMSCIDV